MRTLGEEVASAFHGPMDEARRYGVSRDMIDEYRGDLNGRTSTFHYIRQCLEEDHVDQLPRIDDGEDEDDHSRLIRIEKGAGQAVAETVAAISTIESAIERAREGRIE